MNIKIDENWRVRSDRYQWILEKKAVAKTERSEPTWSIYGYYVSLDTCLADCLQKMVRLTEGDGLAEAIDYAKSCIDAALQQANHLTEAQKQIKANVEAIFSQGRNLKRG